MRFGAGFASFVLGALLSGCGSAVLDVNVTCELAAELSASAAAPGDAIEVAGGPYTEARDTRVKVGGVEATVVHVTREGCSACDACRLDAGCGPCGVCLGEALTPARRRSCFGDPFAGTTGECGGCVETLAFEVPDLPAGPTTVWIVNRDGTSGGVPFEVVPGGTVPATGDTAAGVTATGDTATAAGTP